MTKKLTLQNKNIGNSYYLVYLVIGYAYFLFAMFGVLNFNLTLFGILICLWLYMTIKNRYIFISGLILNLLINIIYSLK